MLTEFMIPRPNLTAPRVLVLVLAVAAIVTVACEKVPLMAPSGSSIILTSPTTALPVHGSADLVATVLESSGTPPHSGTLVSFTTSLGRIEPSDAQTDLAGRVFVKFRAGGSNGTATITATSGAATTGTEGSVKIAIGTAAVGRVIVNASPATVSALGGSTSVSASVLDINGNTLPATPVAFSTTAGTLSAALVNTDVNGVATITLTTSQQATVTASVGATAPPTGGTGTGTGTTTSSGQASGSVTVNVIPAPTIVITPPGTPPSAGLPAAFTVAVTVPPGGSAVRDVRIFWGDGGSQSLGALSGSQVVSHVFSSDGTYTVSATATDSAGNVGSVSTTVTVIPVPQPTIVITYSPVPARVNAPTTINILVTVPQGISVRSTAINFGDGTSASLGGATSAAVPHVYTVTNTYTVSVTVQDTAGQTTVGFTSVSVSP